MKTQIHSQHIAVKKYHPLLSVKETEKAILKIKSHFQNDLSVALNLQRISSPLFVESGTGINDDLNGIEKCVTFGIKDMGGTKVEIVQSLAKWKRVQLMRLDISPGLGIYTDMNAIRPDEGLDYLHSLYVDQWDWERVISQEDRNIAFLKKIVNILHGVLQRAEKFVCHEYPEIPPLLPEEITFFTTQELEDLYPELTPKERENKVCEKHGAVFVIGIGGELKSGSIHDGRAPDYDDWSCPTELGAGLNGDILVWHPVMKQAYEISSMGIRVNKESLLRQLQIRNAEEKKELYFHKLLLENKLPLSIGGGLGQSRICAYLLRKAHIGEVQASVWPQEAVAVCKKANIFLL